MIAKIIFWILYVFLTYVTIFWLLVFFEGDNKQKSKKSKLPSVTVIIPAYNEAKTISKTIKSVLALDYPARLLSIIVVDDGSTDNTASIVKQIIRANPSANIKLIRQKNQGKAAALNKALTMIDSELFACLDADSIVSKHALKRMVALFNAHGKRLAIVTPALKVAQPKNFLQKLQSIEYLVSMFFMRVMARLNCITVAPGPFSLYRTEVVKDLGGFEVGNLTEDQEIAYRVQSKNLKIAHCRDAYVYTFSPRNLRAFYKQRNRWYKGAFINAIKYRNLFWNRAYGDFGAFQMTMNFAMFALSIAYFILLATNGIKPLLRRIYNLFLIRFEVLPYLKNLNFDFHILDIAHAEGLLMIFALILTSTLIILAFKNANEARKKSNYFFAVPFIVCYYTFLVTSLIVISIVQLLFKRVQKW